MLKKYFFFWVKESNLQLNNVFKQERDLRKIMKESDRNIELKLIELRNSLINDNENFRFYMCADLNKLHSFHEKLDTVWLKNFYKESFANKVCICNKIIPF